MSQAYDWAAITNDLTKLLRIEPTPVGMKWCEKEADIQQIEKVRTTEKRYSVCQVMGQAIYFNWTIAVRSPNIHANYCRCIHGMFAPDEKFHSGKMFLGAWCGTEEAAREHHGALDCVPPKYEAIVFSPLSSGRIADPDACVIYANSAQIFMLLCGLTHTKYQKLDFTFVGESTCSDSWVRTFLTGKPSVSIPCFAERKFGGVKDGHILATLKPSDLVVAIEGLKMLSKSGLRYPIPPHSLLSDIMGGLPASYAEF